ncbi:MAG: right-handed parallel beta-helix repeat-containing protein, partial [Blastocatellia bacterium]|nr:right-handed parallel beta-helix repeat-containing protein [Blastocatellia bacterium]
MTVGFRLRLFIFFLFITIVALYLQSQPVTKAQTDKPVKFPILNIVDVVHELQMMGHLPEFIDQEFFAAQCQQYGVTGPFAERLAWFEKGGQKEPKQLFQTNVVATQSPLLPMSEVQYQTLPEIVVTSAAQDGPGSLKAAMQQAEVAGGGRRVVFHLERNDPNFDARTGTWVIPVTESMVSTKSSLLIDGFSQAQYGGETNPNGPEVYIDSTEMISSVTRIGNFLFVNGCSFFFYSGDQNWIRGLGFKLPGRIIPGAIRFSAQFDLTESSTANRFTDSFVNITPDGENYYSGSAVGIFLDPGATNCLIENNVVAVTRLNLSVIGNLNKPDSPNATNNTIRNNRIGTNTSGTRRLPVVAEGADNFLPPPAIQLITGTQNNIVENNIIAGSRGAGIGRLNFFGTEAGLNNIIRNNRIGVGANGENIAPPGDAANPQGPNDEGSYAIGILANYGDTITGNIIGNFPLAGIKARDLGATIPAGTPPTTIQNNTIFNSAFGIEVGQLRGAVITNNTISDCTRGGVVVANALLDASNLYGVPAINPEAGGPTLEVTVSSNTFTNLGGPRIALTPSVNRMLKGEYVPNTARTLQSEGPNLYQPTPLVTAAR